MNNAVATQVTVSRVAFKALLKRDRKLRAKQEDFKGKKTNNQN